MRPVTLFKLLKIEIIWDLVLIIFIFYSVSGNSLHVIYNFVNSYLNKNILASKLFRILKNFLCFIIHENSYIKRNKIR